MTISKFVLAAMASLILTPAAFAQAADPAPAATSATPTAAAYSDEDVQKYAVALLAVNKIQKDAAVADADKPAKFGEAVTAAGLDSAKFNEMSQAMQKTPELNTRIQAAAAASQTPAPAAAN